VRAQARRDRVWQVTPRYGEVADLCRAPGRNGWGQPVVPVAPAGWPHTQKLAPHSACVLHL